MRNRILIVAAGAATLASGALLPAAGAAGATGDGSDAVPMCGRSASYVVSHRDVDGDGRRDTIKSGGSKGQTVIVKINGGETLRRSIKGSFVEALGASRIDGRRGAEIVVADGFSGGQNGARMDARVLTYRKHHLYLLAAPTGGRQWRSHSMPGIESGWSKHRAHNRRYLTHRVVRRVDGGKRFTGRAVDFRWQDGDWTRAGSRKLHFPSRKAANRIVGWRMQGVEYWAGC
ncbi:hypothetical protein [Solicola gregarius]|uniref:VCBS repeat-containing protein n=1 Tax=Solicola gregarius TaxID=2908642 RepID=A0AA46TIS4_9ACTN|nr:hypothetical protein [Solicola gregarius]UYM05976.1 hypothetical protein L0C25_02555 [Solicola gregarius]